MFNDLYLGVHVRLTPQACRTGVIFLCFSVEGRQAQGAKKCELRARGEAPKKLRRHQRRTEFSQHILALMILYLLLWNKFFDTVFALYLPEVGWLRCFQIVPTL